eukprot:6815264-Lingulodinium_polyedra.AAC.1
MNQICGRGDTNEEEIAHSNTCIAESGTKCCNTRTSAMDKSHDYMDIPAWKFNLGRGLHT